MLNLDLLKLLRESIKDMRAGRVSPVEEKLDELRKILAEQSHPKP